MSFRSLSAFDVKANWPSRWGTSGKLVVCLDRSVTLDGVEYPRTQNEGMAYKSLGFHFESAITVANGVATCASIADLPTTDTAVPTHTARYNIYIYDAKGVMREHRGPFHLHESVNGDSASFTWQQWVVAQQFKQGSALLPMIGDRTTFQAMLDAFVSPFAALATRGWVYLTRDPLSASLPYAVGTNDYRMAPSTGGRILVANQFPGASIAAQINAADLALGADKGEIWAFGGGTLAVKVTISSYHVLRLFPGTYTNAYSDSATYAGIELKDNSALYGCGDATIINEGVTVSNGYRLISSWAGNNSLQYADVSNNIRVENLRIQGNAANPFDGGIRAAIFLGNCRNGAVRNVNFDKCTGYGIQIGATKSSIPGYYAENIEVTGCVFDEVPSQNLAVISANNVRIDGNTFRALKTARTAQGSIAVIDLEPNHANDRLNRIQITNNVLDLTSAVVTTTGILAGRIIGATDIAIDDNIITGDSGNNSNGIYAVSITGLSVRNNQISTFVQSGIRLDTVGHALVVNNRVVNCGSVDGAISLMSVTNSTIEGNNLRGSSSLGGQIFESGTNTNNVIRGNRLERIEHLPVSVSIPVSVVTASYYLNNVVAANGSGVTPGIYESANSNGNAFVDNLSAVISLVGSTSWKNHGVITIDPASVAAGAVSSQTFTLQGAMPGDSVTLNPPPAGLTTGLLFSQPRISAANQVTVVFFNTTGGALNEPSGNWHYSLTR